TECSVFNPTTSFHGTPPAAQPQHGHNEPRKQWSSSNGMAKCDAVPSLGRNGARPCTPRLRGSGDACAERCSEAARAAGNAWMDAAEMRAPAREQRGRLPTWT